MKQKQSSHHRTLSSCGRRCPPEKIYFHLIFVKLNFAFVEFLGTEDSFLTELCWFLSRCIEWSSIEARVLIYATYTHKSFYILLEIYYDMNLVSFLFRMEWTVGEAIYNSGNYRFQELINTSSHSHGIINTELLCKRNFLCTEKSSCFLQALGERVCMSTFSVALLYKILYHDKMRPKPFPTQST